MKIGWEIEDEQILKEHDFGTSEVKYWNKWTSKHQRLRILSLYLIDKKNWSEISEITGVSYQTVWRIMQNFLINSKETSEYPLSKEAKLSKWVQARKALLRFINTRDGTYNVRDIQKFIKDSAKVKISKRDIICILKNEWRMSYRKSHQELEFKIPNLIQVMKTIFRI